MQKPPHEHPHSHGDTPIRQDVTVTSSPYYRMRADAQRRLKSSRTVDRCLEEHRIGIVQAWRKANHLTKAELSEKADVLIEEINDIESGNFNSPMITYIKIAKSLRIHISMILGSNRATIS
ncbi:hypothetical protein [Labrys sp. 22185]|uniref:hypothetical protein n=1 Tax=Labrys sp. 22185 TaxID=3453888 RepID=UPI003F87782D